MKKPDNESGYIVVETAGSFVMFVLLIVSILSLVNIMTMQARVHYALTQAANTIAVYCYVLEVTGVADTMKTIDRQANDISERTNGLIDNINGVIDGVKTISLGSAVEHAENAIDQAADLGSFIMDDPVKFIQHIANYGINESKNQLFETIVRPMVGRYLQNGDMSGDEYLKSVKVVNSSSGKTGLDALEFHSWENLGQGNSSLIDRNGNVKLTVAYEVEYTFGVLQLPFNPTLRITQTVITKAWLGGSGEGYRK